MNDIKAGYAAGWVCHTRTESTRLLPDDLYSNITNYASRAKNRDINRMKKIVILVLATALTYVSRGATNLEYGVTSGQGGTGVVTTSRSAVTLDAVAFGFGQSRDHIDIYRLGLRSDFGRSWLHDNLTGFFEASANYWNKNGDEVVGAGFSPVFVVQPKLGLGEWRPYIDGGIGVAGISRTQIAGRDMSSLFQFEDRVGVGVKWRRLDLNVGYLHYSNANIVGPNQGIDIYIATVAYAF